MGKPNKKTKKIKDLTKLQRKENVENIKIDKAGHSHVGEYKKSKSFKQRNKKKFIRFPFWSRRNLRTKPEKTYVITMHFSNGTKKMYVVTTSKSTFKIKSMTYFIYYEEAWYNLSLGLYELEYHENFAPPINREVLQDGDEAYFVVTPANLKKLIDFEYVKVLTGAHSIAKLINFILILLIVSVGLQVISLFFRSAG